MLSTSRIHILYLSIISRLHFPLIFLYFSIISQSSLGYISHNLFATPSYRRSLHVLTCPNMSFLTCPYMSLHVLTCPYMPFLTCPSMSFLTRPYMPLHVLTCPYMSFLTCPYMSLHVLTCPYMSLHALTQIYLGPDLVVNHCSANIHCRPRFVLKSFLHQHFWNISGGCNVLNFRRNKKKRQSELIF